MNGCVYTGALLWWMCASATGHAQANDEPAALRVPESTRQDAPAEAVTHYRRGRELYLAGRYGEALDELEAALALDRESLDLQYNVARLHELLGDIDDAIAAYERYRALLPVDDGAELARTDATLVRLRGARTEVQREPVVPPPVFVAPPPERKHGVADAAFWTLGAVGVGALLGAAGTGGYALWLDGRHAEFVLGRDGDTAAYDREATRLGRAALASDVLTIAGTTVTLSAILLYALRTRPVEPLVGATGNTLWLGVRGRL